MLAARLGTGAGLAAAAEAILLQAIEPIFAIERTRKALLSAHQIHGVVDGGQRVLCAPSLQGWQVRVMPKLTQYEASLTSWSICS